MLRPGQLLGPKPGEKLDQAAPESEADARPEPGWPLRGMANESTACPGGRLAATTFLAGAEPAALVGGAGRAEAGGPAGTRYTKGGATAAGTAAGATAARSTDRKGENARPEPGRPPEGWPNERTAWPGGRTATIAFLARAAWPSRMESGTMTWGGTTARAEAKATCN